MDVQVEQICKAFGEYAALDHVSVTIPSGQLTALLGPSGSGKTTLLRVIAGIEAPDGGRVKFGSTDVTNLPVRSRGVGFVFQDYALFDHMTVAENIAFGLSVRKTAPAQIDARVRDLLARVQLSGLASRYPKQLSGGQRQRVALARALAPDPQLLLLDEPFGALDARVRAELRGWLRRLHDELHLTSVFVTHDQEEALEVADQIVVMSSGKIEQAGAPDEVFERPASAFVMDFLGGVNVLEGHARGDHAVFGDLVLPYTGSGTGRARAYVRGEDLVLRQPVAGDGGDAAVPVTVERVRRRGITARVLVHSEEHGELTAEVPHHELVELGVERGTKLVVEVRSARIFVERERAA
ncbi:MAG TPA: sulfate/molybdate ABC transporter ATP-binding protein [Kofleriaceae bacterium]|nr:sulfate/molybdate ABC transporter ATP-binding protein [Kofleriaceae bacterium]